MRDSIDVLLPSVSGTIATVDMTSKPLLGFARAEGGGCIEVFQYEFYLTKSIKTLINSIGKQMLAFYNYIQVNFTK